ncbi:MAG: hypothetical protein JW809_14235 [Pirellulales bacterium]|nr:hypothetical protein [Pirellulales bacterium]
MRIVRALALFGALMFLAGPAAAAINTPASSTMVFEGALTLGGGGGGYVGTINAVAGTYYMPGGPGAPGGVNPDGTTANGGWDVYAKTGGTAYVSGYTPQTHVISDHDAYNAVDGWGDYYDPDVPDWYNYQLTFDAGRWYLEYKGDALATPMSGNVDWVNLYAWETDTGSYRGVVPADPDANDGDAALNGGGPAAWDMDWTWGSEAIPLEYPGFVVSVEEIDGGLWRVTMTPSAPVPEPAAIVVWSLLGGLGLAMGYWRKK